MELIGKQIAIETILGQPPELHYPSWYASQIEKLPPAPPEYLAEQAGILVTDSDTISRQAAIDAIDEISNEVADGYGFDYAKWREYFCELPPAQPVQCEDAVSRQTLKDGFTEMCNLICPYSKKQQHVMCGSCLMGTAFDVLEATPPVTPKQRTGKWIRLDMHAHLADHKCTACEQECYVPTCMGEPLYAFCPNCGAKMEVTE